jgi:hypothetical protein
VTVCEKCGHDPEHNLCKFCGAASQTLAKFGDELLTICCHKDPAKAESTETSEGGK